LCGIMFRSTWTDDDGKPVGADKTLMELEECYADEKCQGVVLKINSPGGMEDAAYLLSDAVKRRNKPVAAWVNFGECQSGGTMVASGCDLIVASSDTDRVGGIGAYTSYTNYAKMLEMQGIKSVDIYAPESPQKNLMTRKAGAGDYSLILEYVSERAVNFQTMVYVNRLGRWNETEKKLLKDVFEGAELSARDAVRTGLIDGIGSLDYVFGWIYGIVNQL
jgi:protease IV